MANEPVEWSDDLHLGVDFLDEDHKKLVEMIGTWCEAVASDQGVAGSDGLFKDLLDFARQHFKAEEDDMASRCYQDSDFHRREHEALIARLDDTFRTIYSNTQYDLATESIDFVRDWAASHIVTLDRQYAEFLKRQTV